MLIKANAHRRDTEHAAVGVFALRLAHGVDRRGLEIEAAERGIRDSQFNLGILYARGLGVPALTGKVRLVQETSTDVQFGVLLYLPVFRQGLPIDTTAQRERAFIGWVYSPFRLGDLITGTLGDAGQHLRIRVFDGHNLSADTLLFDSHPDASPADKMGLDIGPESQKLFHDKIVDSKTVVWNGPMGVFEVPTFAEGTKAVAQALVDATAAGAFTIVGGGDSASAVRNLGFPEDGFSHISTGGGASLEFLEGKELPGLKVLD